LKKWGYFEVRKVGSGGDDDEREAVIQNVADGKVEVLLVSQTMITKLASSLKKKVKFALMVVDECHNATNPKTHLHEALKSLVSICGCRIGLTGTPMSNSHKELFHLLNLFDPGTHLLFFTPLDSHFLYPFI
jgi:SNF2 family DNA or RNA helicase